MRKRVSIVAAVMAVTLMLATVAVAQVSKFTDVPADHLFVRDISWAESHNIARGYGDGRFGPEDNVTRGQVMAFLHRYHNALGGSGGAGLDGATGLQGPQGPKGDAGATGPKGDTGEAGSDGRDGAPGLANVSVDGPYPGEGATLQSILDDGRASSDDLWSAGQMNVSWVRCADEKVAIGGGFKIGAQGPGDLPPDNNARVFASYPAYIDGSGVIVSETNAESIALGLPDDWSFEPNGWVVEGGASTDIVVRPFVVCAAVGS